MLITIFLTLLSFRKEIILDFKLFEICILRKNNYWMMQINSKKATKNLVTTT